MSFACIIHTLGLPPETCVEQRVPKRSLSKAESKLTKLTQPYGTQDPDRLQLLREQADEIDRKTQHIEEQISELLGDDRNDELNQQLP